MTDFQQTPEQAAWQVANQARRARLQRELVAAFKLWRWCPRKPCRRNKGCSAAEAGPCLDAFFTAMPDRMRIEFGMMVKAVQAGATLDEAQRQVKARIAAVEAAYESRMAGGGNTGDGNTRAGTRRLS